MRALVLPLRRAGIELPSPRPEADWIDGDLLLTKARSKRGDVQVLELRLVGQHAPDRAETLMQLYEPTWVAFGHGEMTVRGFERVTSRAIVMQEWRIDPAGPARRSWQADHLRATGGGRQMEEPPS